MPNVSPHLFIAKVLNCVEQLYDVGLECSGFYFQKGGHGADDLLRASRLRRQAAVDAGLAKEARGAPMASCFCRCT